MMTQSGTDIVMFTSKSPLASGRDWAGGSTTTWQLVTPEPNFSSRRASSRMRFSKMREAGRSRNVICKGNVMALNATEKTSAAIEGLYVVGRERPTLFYVVLVGGVVTSIVRS